MLKQEFLNELSNRLCHLKPFQIEKAVNYYNGIIDGKIGCGISEEDAVLSLGGTEKAALEFINSDRTDFSHGISKKIKSMPTVTRLISSTILIFICYIMIIVVWAVVLSLCGVALALAIGGIGGVIGGLFMAFTSTLPVGLCFIGGGLAVAAISLILLPPSRALWQAVIAFCSYTNNKIRLLLAKEALAV